MPKRKTKSSTTRKQSGIDGVLSQVRNWSELPDEILHLFSKKLHDISDFIRFRVVCKSWQLSAPVTDSPPQLPWLLEHHLGEHVENGIIPRFYCLLSGKVHTITGPASCRAWLHGPACRYLLASCSESSKMFLLNPLTRDQIYAPWVNFHGSPDYIGSDPIEGGDIVVISGYSFFLRQRNAPPNMMAFWRPNADDWVYVQGVGGYYNATAFCMGQYFSNDNDTGITYVVDIATKKIAYQVGPPEGRITLLKGITIMVESGGKILMLFQHYEDEPCHFDIYRLYFGEREGKPCWVKINDIGDQMLFLQYNRGLSFCASNFPGFKGNCIYFVQDGQYCCRYDIGDGTTEVLPCPFDSVATWFVPSLV